MKKLVMQQLNTVLKTLFNYIIATIKVTKEKGKRWLRGYTCDMWDEFVFPEE